jgi:hypothetical protein
LDPQAADSVVHFIVEERLRERACYPLQTSKKLFADPQFDESHAVFAPNSRLFGLTFFLEPEDLLAQQRHDACVSCADCDFNEFGLFFCDHASVAHPNEAGARAMFDALTTGGRGLVWADFSAPCSAVGNCGAGTFESPFGRLLPEAVTAVPEGGTIRIKSSSTPQGMTLSRPCLIEACGGSAVIGKQTS